jgi:peptide/nickel transport system substrate-binding protein
MGGFAPAHYLKQFHPKYTPKEELDKKVADAKMDNWATLLKNRNTWHLNPELPAVTPWVTVSPINTPTWTLERNPYSVWVDTDGNQLPYIDKIQMTLAENLEVLNLRAIASEYDSQERHTDPAKLPAFLENQQRGGYKVFLDSGAVGSDMLLMFNQSYDGDPEIVKWLTNTDLRRALALGIDRDQLNEAFWLGLGVPGSAAPWEESRYSPGPEYRNLWATLDVAKANAMLDKLGLEKKDAEGFRLRTDRPERLRLQIDTFLGFLPYTQICEMVREQWKKLGVAVEVKEYERSLFIRRRTANEAQIGVDVAWGTENLYAHAQAWLFPFDPTSGLGPDYGTWFASSGTQGKEPPARIKEVMTLYLNSFSVPVEQHYEMGKQIWKIALDEVWSIGTVGLSPAVQGIRISKSSMGNQPARMFNGSSTLSPQQTHPETYFFRS